MTNNKCGECGAFPVVETGPLTQEIARLHNQVHRQAQIIAAAQQVHRLLTDALNCRYGGTFMPVSEKEVRRWRDVLSQVLE